MMTHVIFLDIDGVLNSTRYLQSLPPAGPSGPELQYFLDPATLPRLNAIAAGTGAGVVVTSSWRYSYSPRALERLLRAAGLDADIPVYGALPLDPDAADMLPAAVGGSLAGRGGEIRQWLTAHPDVTHAVILDDDDDMGGLLPWLVQTTYRDGLQPEHIAEARRILTTHPLTSEAV